MRCYFPKHIARVIFLVVCFSFLAINASAACQYSLDGLYTDGESGWNIQNGGHMGSRYTTYSFNEDAPYLEEYYDEVRAGVALWGNYISCVESANGEGLITLSLGEGTQLIAEVTPIPTYNSDNHVVQWTITLYHGKFQSACEAGLGAIVIAHELGHVFGLAHVEGEHRLMYPDLKSTQSVTADDKSGMVVMTHAHVHNNSTTYTIEQHSVAQHKKRCGVCRAFYLVNCTYSSHYHSGNYHYFQMNCSCGNNGVKQISCSPLNCPYSGGQIMQA